MHFCLLYTFETEIQNKLKDKFGHVYGNIRVIPVEKKIYSKQLPLILAEIPQNKFCCDELVSPVESLRKEYDAKKRKLQSVDEMIVELGKSIDIKNKGIQELKEEIERMEQLEKIEEEMQSIDAKLADLNANIRR